MTFEVPSNCVIMCTVFCKYFSMGRFLSVGEQRDLVKFADDTKSNGTLKDLELPQ